MIAYFMGTVLGDILAAVTVTFMIGMLHVSLRTRGYTETGYAVFFLVLCCIYVALGLGAVTSWWLHVLLAAASILVAGLAATKMAGATRGRTP